MKTKLYNVFINTPLMLSLFTLLLISSCAQTDIVQTEESVEQLQNLNDYDSDGVIKAREKCDGTILGAAIDNYGCGKKISSIEPFKLNIKFANNSYIIPSEAYDKIKTLATLLKTYTEAEVVIEGHTSKIGERRLNQTLSENRANAIVAVLINDFDVPKERVSSIGFGFDRLEVDDNSSHAHAANRRIMAELSSAKLNDEMEWTIYTVEQTL